MFCVVSQLFSNGSSLCFKNMTWSATIHLIWYTHTYYNVLTSFLQSLRGEVCVYPKCVILIFLLFHFNGKSIIKTLKCFMSEVCHLFFDDGKIMWSCVCLKCHCIYTLCKAKTCIKMHAMKFNNSNTFIPHQTIFFQSCQFAQSFIYSNTNTMLRFTHGILKYRDCMARWVLI